MRGRVYNDELTFKVLVDDYPRRATQKNALHGLPPATARVGGSTLLKEHPHVKIALIAASLLSVSAAASAGDLSIAIGIDQPGFYGQINIGDYPRPAVIYAQPIVIERGPAYLEGTPIYLHVPPGHEKHWNKHCAEYHACGRRVYFVQDQWYRGEYARHAGHGQPPREERHGERRDGHGHGHGEDRHREDRDGRND